MKYLSTADLFWSTPRTLINNIVIKLPAPFNTQKCFKKLNCNIALHCFEFNFIILKNGICYFIDAINISKIKGHVFSFKYIQT